MSKFLDYEIALYHPDQIFDVVKLLSDNLWGEHDSNCAAFRWKHHENPHTGDPLGVVAIHKGSVVGFRGYFSSKWYVQDEQNTIAILMPCDTVLHPEHHGKGLSVAMGNSAMDRFASCYRIFLNMSAGKNSVPGYLRMGFAPIEIKTGIVRRSLAGDVKYLFRAVLKKRRGGAHDVSFSEGGVTFGKFGDILVSTSPRPEDMTRLAKYRHKASSKIILLQDQNFFKWRYGNVRNKYAFYFYRPEETILGYLVLFLSENRKGGIIVDYGQQDCSAIAMILDHLVNSAEFDQIKVMSYSVGENLRIALKQRGFQEWRGVLSNKINGKIPILVRPVRREYSGSDWYLKGLDIRDKETWQFKQICSDSA